MCWSLVDSAFIRTFPYNHLCILYRGRLSNPEKEKDVAQEALDEAAVSTKKQKEWFENRIERADELRA